MASSVRYIALLLLLTVPGVASTAARPAAQTGPVAEDTVGVLVAARDLYQGVQIEADDVYVLYMPVTSVPEGVFLSAEHVVGRIPRERVLANEMVRCERLSDPENGIGLNAVIPRGMRAVTVGVDQRVEPGSYVDVGVAGQGGPVLQGVFVLAQHEAAPMVTLLVTAAEAEQVAHADAFADLVLVARPDLPGPQVFWRSGLEVKAPVRTRDRSEPRFQPNQISGPDNYSDGTVVH